MTTLTPDQYDRLESQARGLIASSDTLPGTRTILRECTNALKAVREENDRYLSRDNVVMENKLLRLQRDDITAKYDDMVERAENIRDANEIEVELGYIGDKVISKDHVDGELRAAQEILGENASEGEG